jgi:hypothetical protein
MEVERRRKGLRVRSVGQRGPGWVVAPHLPRGSYISSDFFVNIRFSLSVSIVLTMI